MTRRALVVVATLGAAVALLNVTAAVANYAPWPAVFVLTAGLWAVGSVSVRFMQPTNQGE